GRLRGVVLIGRDRALIREALARHAPEVPVVDLDRADTGAMLQAVQEAQRLARPGDTVLLAPACASLDMFTNYIRRGEAFAQAVRELGAGPGRLRRATLGGARGTVEGPSCRSGRLRPAPPRHRAGRRGPGAPAGRTGARRPPPGVPRRTPRCPVAAP